MKYCVILLLCLFAFAACLPAFAAEAEETSTFTLWQLPNQTPTQMMSYVLQTAHGKLIVIDGGTAGDAPYLADFLKERGNHVEAWFITHPHSDHFGAITEILKAPGELQIEAMYGSLPPIDWVRQYASEDEAKYLTQFNEALDQDSRRFDDLALGQTMDIDGVHIEVLGIRNPEITGNPINNSSLVLRVSDGKKSVLFPGDLGKEGGDKLLQGPYADRLPSGYVQMAHHGQNGVSEAFYQKVAPAYCLWPTPKWLWDNDKGGGPDSGPWRTLEVRAWMDKLNIQHHYLLWEGLQEIQ